MPLRSRRDAPSAPPRAPPAFTAPPFITGSGRRRAAVEQARREFTESLADDMLDLTHSAVRTLQDLLDNPGTPAAIRLKAALSVLERPQFPKALPFK